MANLEEIAKATIILFFTVDVHVPHNVTVYVYTHLNLMYVFFFFA